LNRVVIICAIAFIALECTPSPRYKISEEPSASSKSNKNSKSSSRYASKSSAKSSSRSNIVFMKPSKEIPDYDRSKKKIKGIASFYGLDDGFHGKLTANGEVFDMNGMTAAHRTLPLGSLVRVTNLENDKTVTLRINDRGPYVRGRELDCSYGVARDLDFVNRGTASVQIDVIEFGDNKYRLNK
tara:strand:- start:805 stop:1356 length:552 start_codon:yes stop_codon:yes gene_type:complete